MKVHIAKVVIRNGDQTLIQKTLVLTRPPGIIIIKTRGSRKNQGVKEKIQKEKTEKV